MIRQDEFFNFETFQDCLSNVVIQRLAPVNGGGNKTKKKKAVKGRKREIKTVVREEDRDGDGDGDGGRSDAAELADFVEYLAEEIFASLPTELRTLSYAAIQDDAGLANKYSVPLETSVLESLTKTLPLAVSDSLCSYGLIQDPASDIERFLEPSLSSYITTVTAPSAEYTPSDITSRPDGCEICDREHLPLTYHHLIPKQVHAKVVKRGWHREWELQKVAWLCRACHSFVHGIATNEELARSWFSVELLLGREDVRRWARWVGKIRWKAR